MKNRQADRLPFHAHFSEFMKMVAQLSFPVDLMRLIRIAIVNFR